MPCPSSWARRVRCGYSCKILYDFLCILRLSGSRFSSTPYFSGVSKSWKRPDLRNQDALVFSLLDQIPKCTVSHSIYVWFGIFSATALVHLHVLVGIDWQRTVWINSDEKEARISLPTINILSHASHAIVRELTYMRSDWYLVCKLWTTEASLRCVSSAMSSALSNFAGLTLSTCSHSTSRCCDGDQLILRLCKKLRNLTLPFSHWTSNRPLFDSSIIHPLVNADCGSRNHTYLLPEKSFSPSIPSIRSLSSRSAAALMNKGAKVLEVWLLLLLEVDLCLVC